MLKKEQVVNVTLEEVNGHMDFDILEIPTQRLGALYALIPNEQQTKMAVPTEKAQKIFYTPDFPARREVFEHLKRRSPVRRIQAKVAVTVTTKVVLK